MAKKAAASFNETAKEALAPPTSDPQPLPPLPEGHEPRYGPPSLAHQVLNGIGLGMGLIFGAAFVIWLIWYLWKSRAFYHVGQCFRGLWQKLTGSQAPDQPSVEQVSGNGSDDDLYEIDSSPIPENVNDEVDVVDVSALDMDAPLQCLDLSVDPSIEMEPRPHGITFESPEAVEGPPEQARLTFETETRILRPSAKGRCHGNNFHSKTATN